MTDFFEASRKLEAQRKSSVAAKKPKEKKSTKKRKSEDSDSSVVESSGDSCVENSTTKKYCIQHGKFSHSTDNCKDLYAMVNKYKQKRKKNFKTYGKTNKKLNALIVKYFKCS